MRVTTDYVPSSSWVSQRTESYVHSSLEFLNDETLRSGEPSAHVAKLQIQPAPPTHLDEANDLQRDSKNSWTFKWTLVTSVNVVRGRDPKRQRKIKGEAAAGARRGTRRRQGSHVEAEEEDRRVRLTAASTLFFGRFLQVAGSPRPRGGGRLGR